MFERRGAKQRRAISRATLAHSGNGTNDNIDNVGELRLDSDLSLYSTRKLWDVVRLLDDSSIGQKGSCREFDLLNITRAELRVRGYAGAENPWKAPH